MHATLHNREYHVAHDDTGQPVVVVRRNALIWDVVTDAMAKTIVNGFLLAPLRLSIPKGPTHDIPRVRGR